MSALAKEDQEKVTKLRDSLYAVHEMLTYIKRTHEGTTLWLNVVPLDYDSFYAFGQALTKSRVHQWFVLGLSIAPLLQNSDDSFLSSLAQLIEEYDHWMDGSNSNMKVIQAHTTQIRFRAEEGAMFKPKINVVGNRVVYDFLRTYNMPIEKDLDYLQVVLSLCYVLDQAYLKLASGFNGTVYIPIIQKIDSRIRHHFFTIIFKELNKYTQEIAKEQMGVLVKGKA